MRDAGSNFTARIVSVVIAVFLWFYVTTEGTFSTKFTVPIRYVGPSDGYVLASKRPDEATVVLNGTGKELVIFYFVGLFRPGQRYALVNLTGLPEGSSKITLNEDSFNFGLFSGLRVESILYPDNASFTVEIDSEIKRTVSVNVDSLPAYRVEDGYVVVGTPAAKPAFVVLQGPSSVISAINHVLVESLSGGAVSPSDSVLTGALEAPEFVTVNPDEVNIVFHVERVVTRQIAKVPLTLKGFPRRNRITFRPDSLTVEVKGPSSLVAVMESGRIGLTVDYGEYREIAAAGDSLIAPAVTVPEGVSVVSVSPKTVLFSTPPS